MKTLKQVQKFGWLPVLLLTAQLSHGQTCQNCNADFSIASFNVDYYNKNSGGLENSLRFGYAATGEAIGSNRTGGDNLNGLDLYTAYSKRLSITNLGKVGIGTTAPTLNLDVVGSSLGLRTNAAWDHIYFTHDGSTATMRAGGANTGLALQVGIGVTGTYGDASQNYRDVMRLLANGNVGVGTTTPTQKLDVNGNANVTGTIQLNTYDVDKIYLTVAGAAGSKIGHASGWGVLNYAGPGNAATTAQGFHSWFTSTPTGYAEQMRITPTGVGIGTTAPISQLANTASNIVGTDGTGANAGSLSWLMSYGGYTTAIANTGTSGISNGLAVKVASTTGVALDVSQNAAMGTAGTSLLRVNGNGTVGIGTASPQVPLDVAGNTRLNGSVLIGANITRFNSALATYPAYSLWVEQGVVANDFAIAAPATWADFVFAPSYRLAPLAETERYIRQHGHLPQMPSADDVKKDGYSVHEMNTRLLQKIEELTLHAIEQEKQLAETRALLQPYAQLAAEMASLKAKLEK